ncbi:MAG: asparagine--tRNA ligase [Magnetococcales bacterium]|nr:asparagine--tRNA ligase [Magnetococcales bacterium]|tara:strand:- start:12512 stop:14107 length:1596 start_codon:yes stop_codon:yes gene_type:complete
MDTKTSLPKFTPTKHTDTEFPNHHEELVWYINRLESDSSLNTYKAPYDDHYDIMRYLKYLDKPVTVWGRVSEARHQQELSFLKIQDGTSFKPLQCVIDWTQHETQRETWQKIKLRSSIVVTGIIRESPQELKKFQRVELHVQSIEIQGLSDPEVCPMKKRVTLQQVREYPELAFSSRFKMASLRIRHVASMGTHEFFDQRKFWYTHTPLITGADCEGAGEVVQSTTMFNKTVSLIPQKNDKVDFSKDQYGKPSYLTVSGQLHVEGACLAYQRVYTFGPFFRAEGTCSRKHLSEGWMVEPEHIVREETGLNDTIDLAVSYIKHLIGYTLKRCPDEIDFCDSKFMKPGHREYLELLLEKPTVTISYDDVIELLLDAQTQGKVKFETIVTKEMDLDAEHEKWIVEYFDNAIVAVMLFPKDIKAFYMKESPSNPNRVESFDILVKDIGEIVGGSVREHRLEKLQQVIESRGMDQNTLDFYMRMRTFGTAPHAGFGLGFDRMIMMLTGYTGYDSGKQHPDIREVMPYPRQSGSIIC